MPTLHLIDASSIIPPVPGCGSYLATPHSQCTGHSITVEPARLATPCPIRPSALQSTLKLENIVNRLEISCAELIRIRQDFKLHCCTIPLILALRATNHLHITGDIEEDYKEYQHVF